MPKPIDITGHRFGRLVAVSFVPKQGWLCHCDCGHKAVIQRTNLKNGVTQSCGCLHRELARAKLLKHGHTSWQGPKSKTYMCWRGMIARCTNPKMQNWKWYGGRGITVCDRWRHSFKNFLADMGEKPPGLSIDRIDVNGNYEPSNCRWATSSEQFRNRERGARGRFT